MQLDFFARYDHVSRSDHETIMIAARPVLLEFVRNRAAKRYILRVTSEGAARVTIPRGGSLKAARDFAGRHRDWIEQQLLKFRARRSRQCIWKDGTEILFRGERMPLRLVEGAEAVLVEFGGEQVPLMRSSNGRGVRGAVESHLWEVAERELRVRTLELALQHGVRVKQVTVRNQRSRWGSCSSRGMISLNWRLIQAPEFVRDYIILHELMHLKEMNHSRRFWRLVEDVCPEFRTAEQWLKKNNDLLR